VSMSLQMHVSIGLPGVTLFDGIAVRVNAVASNGAFGVLPNHVDFVTALVPSVLLITQPDGMERIFGVAEGLFVKQGHEVDIAVRRGVESADLETVQATVEDFFAASEDHERVARTALSRLEADIVRRFAALRTSS